MISMILRWVLFLPTSICIFVFSSLAFDFLQSLLFHEAIESVRTYDDMSGYYLKGLFYYISVNGLPIFLLILSGTHIVPKFKGLFLIFLSLIGSIWGIYIIFETSIYQFNKGESIDMYFKGILQGGSFIVGSLTAYFYTKDDINNFEK